MVIILAKHGIDISIHVSDEIAEVYVMADVVRHAAVLLAKAHPRSTHLCLNLNKSRELELVERNTAADIEVGTASY